MNNLLFLKLGGSLINRQKRTPYGPAGSSGSARSGNIIRSCIESTVAPAHRAWFRIIWTHPGSEVSNPPGSDTPQEWLGFTEVWREAIALNSLVMKALHKAGIPAISFSPCAQILAVDGKIDSWIQSKSDQP
jgi:isopentenyl phosphate kinase